MVRCFMKNLLFCLVLFLLTGCEQILYDSMHGHEKHQCRSIPNTDERQACQSAHNVPYEVYKRNQDYPQRQPALAIAISEKSKILF